MEKPVQVAVLGTSVILTGIAHALSAQAGLSVHVAGGVGELPHLLECAHPAILLIDLATVAVDDVRPYIYRYGALTLIGIDFTRRQAFTFSNQPNPLRTLDDLTRLIDQLTVSAMYPNRCTAPEHHQCGFRAYCACRAGRRQEIVETGTELPNYISTSTGDTE